MILTLKNNNDVYYLIPNKGMYLLKFIKSNKEYTENLEVKDVLSRMDIIEQETGKEFKCIDICTCKK